MTVIVNYSTEKELEEDFAHYVSVALQDYHGGFSKGTANVSPHDVKKLHGLLDYYRKKPHPFTACVRDNRKRFGPLTEKYCAVLKDIIEGNTHWRNQKKKNLSEDTLKELYALDVPEGFLHWLSEWEPDFTTLDLAEDVPWNPHKGFKYLMDKLNAALNMGDSGNSMGGMGGDGMDSMSGGMYYWVCDIDLEHNDALVCEGDSMDHYVVPFTVDNVGDVTISDQSEWTKVEEAWVDSNSAYLSEGEVVAEVFLAGDGKTEERDGLIWKTIAKEGTWKYSPGPGQRPVAKPLTFVRSGNSDTKSFTVSIEELKKNFEEGAKQHVTVPLTHDDKVDENTGFIRQLKIEEDESGKALLKAGIEFTEPAIKEKVLHGSIADISSGIHFDYIKKDDGRKYNAIIAHTALTNNPWLNGMAPFETTLSENVEIMAFSEEVHLAGNSKKPYGNVKYADPGYQADKKARYPVDTEEHARAAWSYINQADNAAKYSAADLKKVKAAIVSALKKFKVQVNMSEESSQSPQGGDKVEAVEETTEEVITPSVVQPTFLSELGISEDEAKARLAEYESLKTEQKLARVDERCRKWQEEGVSPALVLAAKSILEADNGVSVLNLSEDGKDTSLTASDIVDRLISAAPHVNLAEDKVTDQAVEGQAPPVNADDENGQAKLSLAERSLAAQLMMELAMSEDEAIAEAKQRLGTKE